MNKKIYYKIIGVLILFSLFGFLLIFNIHKHEPTKVIEIPDTLECYNDPDTNLAYITRTYIVVNAPSKPKDIKNLMVNYYKKHKEEIESLNELDTNLKVASYTIYFYKEGWNFTRFWKPDLTYVDSVSEYVLDQLRDFSAQRIGFLTFCPSNNEDIGIVTLSNDESTGHYKIPHSTLE